ncbi:HAD family hydrolase [Thermaerobacter sp. FW80]|nr:HAD family hydrolase [Thermaerobacter sp. FW80]
MLYSVAYTRALAAHLPESLRDAFLREAFPFSDVNRRLRMGRIYDRIEDVLLGHPRLEPGVVVGWEGTSASRWRPVADAGGYVGAPGRYLALGDAWMLATATALRFGTEPLRVLVTNATARHAETILGAIGLEGAFSHRVTEAGKPQGWRRIIPWLEQTTGVPRDSMLVVGDNLLNDVLPVRELGVQAVLLDRYGLYPRYPARDWAVIRSLEPLFTALAPKAGRRLVPS